MRRLRVGADDRALVEAAFGLLKKRHRPGHHHVAAVIRGAEGRLHEGLHLNSRTIDVCAEWVALGAAAVAGDRSLETIVAVARKNGGRPRVVSPCGTCRDLLLYTAPDIAVLFVEGGKLRKARIEDLVPGPYLG